MGYDAKFRIWRGDTDAGGPAAYLALDPGSGTLGLTGIAVALPAWAPGDPPLALGVAVPSEQADDARVATVAEALAEAAGRLTNPWRERAATERP